MRTRRCGCPCADRSTGGARRLPRGAFPASLLGDSLIKHRPRGRSQDRATPASHHRAACRRRHLYRAAVFPDRRPALVASRGGGYSAGTDGDLSPYGTSRAQSRSGLRGQRSHHACPGCVAGAPDRSAADAGGSGARAPSIRRGAHTEGAFLFPQMTQYSKTSAENNWSPGFIDYLFIAFNTSTAFSPSDTPVLSRWAKVLTMLQSAISLIIVALLASRAIGIL